MKCPRCQKENPSQAKFCLDCAKPLALGCWNGNHLPAAAKFCFERARPPNAAGAQPPVEDPDRIPRGVDLTALDATFRTDPRPMLARLRRDEPVHYDGVINRWVLTRHDDVERVLRDRMMSLDPHKANEGTYMRLF